MLIRVAEGRCCGTLSPVYRFLLRCVLVAIVAAFVAPTHAVTGTSALQQARLLMADSKYAEATAVLKQAVDSVSASTTEGAATLRSVRLDLATCYRATSDWQNAISAYRLIEAAYPDQVLPARYFLGVCLARLKAYAESLAIMRKALAEAPVSVPKDDACLRAIRADLINFCIESGQFDSGISDTLAWIKSCPQDEVRLKLGLGNLYKGKKDFTNAISTFKYILDKSSNYPNEARAALVGLAVSYCDSGSNESAVAICEPMLAAFPTEAAVGMHVAGSRYADAGKFADAIGVLKKALPAATGAQTKDVGLIEGIRGQLVRCCLATSAYDAAIADYTAWISSCPQDEIPLRLGLARVQTAKRDFDAAVATYQSVRAIKSLPVQTAKDALTRIIECQRAKGDLDKAISSSREMISQYPEEAMLGEYCIGACLCDQSKFEEALAVLKKAMADAPPSLAKSDQLLRVIRADLSRCYFATGALDTGVAESKAWIAQCPEDAVALKLTLANFYRAKKDYDNAVGVLKPVVDVARTSDKYAALSALEWIVESLADGRSYGDAKTFLNSAYEQYPDFRDAILLVRATARSQRTEEYEQAIADLGQLLRDYPSSLFAPDAEYMIGELTLTGLRNTAKARELLQAFAEKRPNYSKMMLVRYYLARCAYIEGNYESAARLFEDALACYQGLSDLRPQILHLTGDCYERLGQTGRAVELWKTVIREYPSDDTATAAAESISRVTAGQTEVAR